MNYEIPEKWVTSVNRGDVDEIMACYDDNASLLATFEARPLKSFEEIRNYFIGFTSKEGSGVRIDQPSLSHDPLGDGFYLATGLYEFYYRKRQLGSTSRSFYLYDQGRPKRKDHSPSLFSHSSKLTKDLFQKFQFIMLSPQKTLDTYYLEARRDLLKWPPCSTVTMRPSCEMVRKAQDESKKHSLLDAMALLSKADHPKANRAEQLLVHFAKIS